MPNYKVTYFDFPGLAEPIRWLLTLLGEDFEDKRLTQEEWATFKSKTPFGKVPLLECDGEAIPQSTAICRYLGRKGKLAGDNEWEGLQVDIVVDAVIDIRQAATAAWYESNEEAKKKKLEALRNETFPLYLGKLDELVKKNNGYLANGKLSWGDIFAVAFLEGLKSSVGGADFLKEWSNLRGLCDKVLALPQIKKWNDSHKKP